MQPSQQPAAAAAALLALATLAPAQGTLSQSGPAEPGQPLGLTVLGVTPNAPVHLGLSPNLLDPPFPHPFGDLWLAPPLQTVFLGTSLPGGTLSVSIPVPGIPSLTGALYAAQALDAAALALTAPIGLWVGPAQVFDSPNLELFGAYGSDVAVGDFLGGPELDLAVGANNETVGGLIGAGRVYVYEGPSFANVVVLEGGQLAGSFGLTLAALDWDGDGLTDLAVGEPRRDPPLVFVNAGAVHVYGHPVGAGFVETLEDPTPVSSQTLGASLVAANLDATPNDEILAGAPYLDGGQPFDTPASVVVFAKSGSLVIASEILEPAPFGTLFGSDVAVGDTDGVGPPEILVGDPLESVGGQSSAGMVHLFTGGGGLIVSLPNPDPGFGDRFGDRVLISDADGDGLGDLFVSDSGEQGARLLAAPGFAPAAVFGVVQAGDIYVQGDIARADVNGDGALDVVVAVSDCLFGLPCGSVSFFLGPSFTTRGFMSLPAGSSVRGPRRLSVGDLDGDGEDEVLGGALFSTPAFLSTAGEAVLFR